ncbi:MAG: GTP cyclohydrolase I FolE [Acidobacteria bacterium]|nr:GTP cyclohydrolase I FolE [Acidobacteriota bacterium]
MNTEHLSETLLSTGKEDDRLESLARNLLVELGEDPDRDGLERTPRRVAESLRFLTKGYQEDVDQVLNGALYEVAHDEMIIVRDIEVFSLCEHHLLPFFGKCHVAYIPSRKVIGLSKIARLVDVFARRLQVQERLTTQVAQVLMEKINPLGVGVVMEAQHLCMIMRGVQKQNSVAVTSAMLGVFRDKKQTRDEFLSLVGRTG